MKVLIACVGNIFLGDDGFGVEVARRLALKTLPPEVTVKDFGIRGFDLAFALMESYDVAVLVDALSQKGRPGELFVLEPDFDQVDDHGVADGHSMDPVAVLRLVKQFGGRPPRLFVVGCEPASLGEEEGYIGLSEPVQEALDGAVALVEELVQRLRSGAEVA